MAGVALPGIKQENTGDSGFCLDCNGAKPDDFNTLLLRFTPGN